MVAGLRHYAEWTADGRPSIQSDDGEVLMHVQEGVGIVLGSRPSESSGTLFISSRQVVWVSDLDRNKSYAVDFLSISLHAVSRHPEAYPSPCIYAQIDTEDDENESEGSDSEAHIGTLDLSNVKEIRLVPSDPTQFFCECAELNPEPVIMEEEEHEWIFSADQLQADEIGEEESVWNSIIQTNSIGHTNGDHNLSRTVLQLQISDQRFDDAEEMGDNGNRKHNSAN
ncbi:hypothetical protein V2J09_013273 [Rumex salicifolius]